MFTAYQYECLLCFLCPVCTCSSGLVSTDYARNLENFGKNVSFSQNQWTEWSTVIFSFHSCLYFVRNVADSSSNYINRRSVAVILVSLNWTIATLLIDPWPSVYIYGMSVTHIHNQRWYTCNHTTSLLHRKWQKPSNSMILKSYVLRPLFVNTLYL